ncbi:MAG: hypothetical protein ACJ8AI_00760 [Rhodopila sp.]
MPKLPLPDEQPIAVNALRNMRARIAGEIEMHSREIDRLRAELVHLDATMQLFDPETEPSDVPALRRYPRRTEWFARGEVTQHIYEAFREQEVIWPRQIAKQAIAEKGISETDKKILKDIVTRFASTTAGVGAKFVVSNGFGGPAADAGGASATRGGRPRGQAAGPRPGARADGALPAQ